MTSNHPRWGGIAALAVALSSGANLSAQDTVDAVSMAHIEEDPLDRIELRGGGRLTGNIVSIDSKHIVIETESLGRRTVPVNSVAEVIGRDVHVITQRGEEIDVTLESVADGKVVVECDGKDRSFEVATLRTEPIGVRWSASFAIGASARTGNRDSAGSTADIDILARRDEDRLTGKLDWAIQETKKAPSFAWSTTQRRTRGELQYDYLALEDGFVWANSSLLNDEFDDIELQWISGAGAGWDLVKKKQVGLAGSAGLAYVDIDYYDAEDRSFPAGRAAMSFWWKPAQDVKFSNDSSVVPSLKNGDSTEDVIVRIDTRLRWNVVDKFFTQLRWVYDYNRSPSPGFKTTDQNLALTFGWSF